MEPRSNDPASTGVPLAATGWIGQPGGTPQGTPAWVGQSTTLPFDIKPLVLERRPSWSALRLVARTLKVVAWIQLVLGVIMSLAIGGYWVAMWISLSATMATVGRNAPGTGFFGGNAGLVPLLGFLFIVEIFLLVGIVAGFVWRYGFAELILVFLAIEKNTSKSE